MADTIRTLAELNQLFGDNTTGSVSPQDMRDLIISQNVHAEIRSTRKAQITLSSGWNFVELDTAGSFSRGMTIDTTNLWITDVAVRLKALLHYEVHYIGAIGAQYDFAAFRDVDGTPQILSETQRNDFSTTVANQALQVVTSVGVQLQQDDTVALGVRSGTNTFELINATLRLQRIGVE